MSRATKTEFNPAGANFIAVIGLWAGLGASGCGDLLLDPGAADLPPTSGHLWDEVTDDPTTADRTGWSESATWEAGGVVEPAAPVVTPEGDMVAGEGNLMSKAVGFDPGGRPVLAWSRFVAGEGTYVEVAWGSIDGSWETPVRLAGPSQQVGSLEVITGSYGRTYVVWQERTSTHTLVRVAGGGYDWGWSEHVSELLRIPTDVGNVYRLVVRSSTMGYVLVAAVVYVLEARHYEVRMVSLEPGETWIEEPTLLLGQVAFTNAPAFDLFLHGRDDWIAAWVAPVDGDWQRQVVRLTRRTRSASWDQPVTVSTLDAGVVAFAISYLDGVGAHATWVEHPSGDDGYMRLRSWREGGATTVVAKPGTYGWFGWMGTVAWDLSGRVTWVWREGDAEEDQTRVTALKFEPNEGWGEPALLAQDLPAAFQGCVPLDDGILAVDMDGAGNTAVAWEQRVDDTDTMRIRAVISDDSAGWSAPELISPEGAGGRGPTIAAEDGAAVVVWSRAPDQWSAVEAWETRALGR